MSAGFTVWLTGLAGAGKTTIAQRLQERLIRAGVGVEFLDGGVVRTHLCQGLGYSRQDRDTNVQRLAFVASLLTRHGVAVITAAISPYAAARQAARQHIGRFVEVYVRCPINELVQRDTQGLYERARLGLVPHFTGVSDPYEAPDNPEVVVDTDEESIDESVQKIWDWLLHSGYLRTTPQHTAPPSGFVALPTVHTMQKTRHGRRRTDHA